MVHDRTTFWHLSRSPNNFCLFMFGELSNISLTALSTSLDILRCSNWVVRTPDMPVRMNALTFLICLHPLVIFLLLFSSETIRQKWHRCIQYPVKFLSNQTSDTFIQAMQFGPTNLPPFNISAKGLKLYLQRD